MSTQKIVILEADEAAKLWATQINVAARLKPDLFSENPAIGEHHWMYVAKPGNMPSSMERDASVFNRSSLYEFRSYEILPTA